MNNKNLVDLLLVDSIKRALKKHGIEGTLEVIEKNYPFNCAIRHKMRETYFTLVYKR